MRDEFEINWFPGHMTKSLRIMQDSIKVADCIIYVLDSRAPKSCMNPLFDELFLNIPKIYVLNKADIGDLKAIRAWSNVLSSVNSVCVSIDSTASKSSAKIIALARELCKSKLEKYKNKGVKTTIRAMVVGVPNVGKSTLINNLCGQARTITGNKPGVTRGKQWVRVNDYFEVLDTPGTLYPKLSDKETALHLAYIGSIKDEVTDTYKLACIFLEDINKLDPTILQCRYKIDFDVDSQTTLELIAKKRGLFIKGGELDLERASTMILDDFRKGRLGKITLDKIEEEISLRISD